MSEKIVEIVKLKTGYAVGAVVLSLALMLVPEIRPVSAQLGQELSAAVSRQLGENMQALTGYSFQRRTEVKVDGETKSVQLSEVSFGPDKHPLITPISSEPSQDTGRGLRGRIRKERMEEMKEKVQQLVQLSNGYLMPNENTMRQLAGRAQVLVNPDDGNLNLSISDLLKPGDHMTMNCDGRTKNRKQTQIQTTSADGNPVTITADYQTLPTGLNFNAQTVINVAAKGLQIMINTMNYQRQ